MEGRPAGDKRTLAGHGGGDAAVEAPKAGVRRSDWGQGQEATDGGYGLTKVFPETSQVC